MNSSSSDRQSYIDACINAVNNEPGFDRFKNDGRYREILEHVGRDDGMTYFQAIKDHPIFVDNINEFRKNDSLGSPSTYTYQGLGNWSPTTLRYIYILTQIVKNFGDLTGKKIVEIGGGYGGQRYILDCIFPNLDYTIIDIDCASKLQEKYLDRIGLKDKTKLIAFENWQSNPTIIESNLCISNWAFSECKEDVRTLYKEKIVNHAKNVFMCASFYDGFTLEELPGMECEEYLVSGYQCKVLIKKINDLLQTSQAA